MGNVVGAEPTAIGKQDEDGFANFAEAGGLIGGELSFDGAQLVFEAECFEQEGFAQELLLKLGFCVSALTQAK